MRILLNLSLALVALLLALFMLATMLKVVSDAAIAAIPGLSVLVIMGFALKRILRGR